MLRIRNLESGYGRLRILKSISMHINPGEIVTIIGGNGAGKSTLLKTISGLINPMAGEIFFKNKNISKAAPENIVKQGCLHVPEGRQVFFSQTIEENLMLGAFTRFNLKNKINIINDLKDIYFSFPRLKERKNQLAGTLSGGEQQMLAIGRALMAKPDLIMFDEPSMGLAPIIVKNIFDIILDLKKKGKTILLVEQNAKASLKIADRAYVLETGNIVLEGDSEELSNNQDIQRAYLGKDYREIAQ
jgi:branched-chain amino acid transport system ATP-binding protein